MADPVVGQIYNPDLKGIYPTAVQPGGIGTPVTSPLQGHGGPRPNIDGIPFELNGKFFSPCGHSFLSWEVVASAVGGTPSALICCPLCRYIARIVTPYALIQDPVQFPLIFA